MLGFLGLPCPQRGKSRKKFKKPIPKPNRFLNPKNSKNRPWKTWSLHHTYINRKRHYPQQNLRTPVLLSQQLNLKKLPSNQKHACNSINHKIRPQLYHHPWAPPSSRTLRQWDPTTMSSSPPWSPSPSPPPLTVLTALLITSIALLHTVECRTKGTVIDSKLLTSKIGSNRTIIVDLDGDEDFTSVQAAIDSVPDGNKEWVIIHLRAGVYR